MSDGLSTRVRGRSGGDIGIVTRIHGRSDALQAGRTSRIRGRITSPAVVTAGTNVIAEPGDTVDLLGALVQGAAGPTSWDWSVDSGPLVTIAGTAGAAARTYAAPALRAPTGTDIVFRVIAHFATGTTATATVTHHINGHGGPWRYDSGGQLVAMVLHIEPLS